METLVATPELLKAQPVLDLLDHLGIAFSPTGLTYSRDLSLSDHEAVLDTLIAFKGYADTVVKFALGDAYNALEAGHGSKKQQIEDKWGEGWYNQLRKMGMVCRAFDHSRRHDKIRWKIYEALVPRHRDFQDAWLAKALKGEASVRRIDAAAKALQPAMDVEEKKAKSQPQWSEGKKFGEVADAAMPTMAVMPTELNPGDRYPGTNATVISSTDTAVSVTHPTVGFEEDEEEEDRAEYHYALTAQHHNMALEIADILTRKRRRLVTVGDVVSELIEQQYKQMTTPYAV